MTAPKLPELPLPFAQSPTADGVHPVYTADQMRAYAAEAVRQAGEVVQGLLSDTQHEHHDCGGVRCPVANARAAIALATGAQPAVDDEDVRCAECGATLELVRPGKHQHPSCGQAPQPAVDVDGRVAAALRLTRVIAKSVGVEVHHGHQYSQGMLAACKKIERELESLLTGGRSDG